MGNIPTPVLCETLFTVRYVTSDFKKFRNFRIKRGVTNILMINVHQEHIYASLKLQFTKFIKFPTMAIMKYFLVFSKVQFVKNWELTLIVFNIVNSDVNCYWHANHRAKKIGWCKKGVALCSKVSAVSMLCIIEYQF